MTTETHAIVNASRSGRRATALGRSIILLFLLIYSHSHLLGQARQAGEIRGTVTDSSGAVIPDVSITITNVLTGINLTSISNKEGLYEAPFVQPGQYMVTFVKNGFSKFVRSGLTLREEAITVDAKLEVGSTTTEVTVTASNPPLETENPDHSTYYTGAEVLEIPNVGQDTTAFLALVPGSSGSGGVSGINGAGALQTNWQLDGGKGTFAANQNPDALVPPLSSVQEIKVSTANFGAEQADGLSIYNVITKSGTNEWHGTVYEYNQNMDYNAKDHFSESKSKVIWNQFGGNFGGPIKRNKAFFYFTYQKKLQSSAQPAYYQFATEAMRGGDFSAPGLNPIYDPLTTVYNSDGTVTRTQFPGNIIPANRLDPIALKIQNFLPLPNTNYFGTPFNNNYYYVNPNSAPAAYISGKVDYNVNSTNKLSATYIQPGYSYLSAAPICSLDCGGFRQPYEISAQVTDDWTIGTNKVNEARFSLAIGLNTISDNSYGKGYPAQLGLLNPVGNIFPSVNVSGTLSTSVGNGQTPYIQYQLDEAPADTFTWTKGKQVFKFGGEYDKWGQEVNWPGVEEGQFGFSGIATRDPSLASNPSAGEGYADFLLGMPGSWGVQEAADGYAIVHSWQFFGEDDYKVKPNLTLTLGMRYIRQGGWSEAHNRLANFSPTLINPATHTPGAMEFAPNNGFTALQNPVNFFAPRVGFAWSPTKGTSIRGGFGLYNYQRGAYQYGGNQDVALGYGITGNLQSADSTTPIFTLSPPTTAESAAGFVQGPPPGTVLTAATRTPDALNGQNVQYYDPTVPMGYTEQYSLDVQHEFPGGIVASVGYVANHGLHLPGWRDMNQVPQSLLGPGNAQARRPFPQFLEIQKFGGDDWSHYNSLQATVKKDFRHGFLFQANYTWGHAEDTETVAAGGGGYEDVWQNANNIRADYGASATDLRHIFNLSIVSQLPFGKGQPFLHDSQTLNTIIGGWKASLLMRAQTGYPFSPIVGGNNLSGALTGTWRPNRIASGRTAHPSIQEWFDPTAFTIPADYTFGNSGRNILYGPHYRDVDLALSKVFTPRFFGENVNLELRGEAFNALNLLNLGTPNYSIYPGGGNGAGQIGWDTGPRTMQVGGKITF